MTVFRTNPLYLPLTAVSLLVVGLFGWTLLTSGGWDALFFIGAGLAGALWFGLGLLSRVELDEQQIVIVRPLLGKRVVERRRLLEVTTSGRLMNVITLIFHATDANGLATEALESAPLPSVADHGELLEQLRSALPASPRA